ncbi:autophagy-related protein 7, putative [Plasmodium berghei]|uniref:Autophagy-related protein 7, putative n=2 Tax=Plasmodium berghei TaxID=5821 RepID=A0A509AJS6_PLABA|nr:autophagy-related protein 7, putative [Plasmodium berghei ANKA]CXI42985.1 autophagy-related protein 7, putative [Plasmodium berghei]SCM22226.1 autophagy-related protein 7, putative [Plasmodium berghei]SCN25342.1 autophagy-related protein 7, putative [Plasmodium berghei]SCO60315.1 autophagy-related protein 7, putative [Plasmodium berghei]SCO62019.1 autophagy-related protein 7, putative [Plasmodium berghei]|eukprot:XP_034421572.1 autophagy-related protein 7, putative [Plasmodium berghei ANKA]
MNINKCEAYSEELEKVQTCGQEKGQILKHCYNEFKIDISFFLKLHEQKINIYKLKSDYVNLISETYVKKIKVEYKYKKINNLDIIEFYYPYKNTSFIEINKNSFETDKICIEFRKNEEKKFQKINNYNKKYQGLLLNFNTLEEFLNANKTKHVNNSMNDIKMYVVCENNEKKKKKCIYDNSFWEYKQDELDFFEKINKYLILSYFDLKKCICYYSISNPVIKPLGNFKEILPSQRLHIYINTENVYLNKEIKEINVIDTIYLSQKIDDCFNSHKMFVKSRVFLLLRFKNDDINDGNYYDEFMQNSYEILSNIQSEENNEFYKINSFKKLYEYIFYDDKYKENSMNDNQQNEYILHCSILRKNLNLVVLPINCLSELKEEINMSKDKVLKNIKKKYFDIYICMIDHNLIHNSLNWDARNLLYFLTIKYELYNFEISLLAFRDIGLLGDQIICLFNKNNELIFKCPIFSKDHQTSSNDNSQIVFKAVSEILGISYDLVEVIDYSEKKKKFNFELIKQYNNSSNNANKLDNKNLNEIKIDLSDKKNKLVKFFLNSSIFNIKMMGISDFFKIDKNMNSLKYEIIPGWKKYIEKKNNKIKENIIYVINLNNFLNKNTIQRISLELNIKLIKWRILKNFKFEKIHDLKILIIGLGTLGCSVARTCVAWGIKNFTFIDNSRVSFSNVSRQSLFNLENAESYNNIGEYKSIAAKNNLLKISPDLNIISKIMDIPMPGHLNYLKNENLYNTIEELDKIIDNHDVVFLLTDSKESRYFPSLLIAEKHYNCLKKYKNFQNNNIYDTSKLDEWKNTTIQYTENITYKNYMYVLNDGIENININPKLISNKKNELNNHRNIFYSNILSTITQINKMPPLGISVALGFDSFQVIRHSYLYFKGGCYFCNDMNSPTDSMSYRTIDEKCTVTRPGISSISSSIATELLISLTQHPLQFSAPHVENDQYICFDSECDNLKNKNIETSNSFASCLGATPHIITFNLSNLSIRKIYSDAFDRCVCCSEPVILKYQENKSEFVKKVISESLVLEDITNMNVLKQADEKDVIIFE